MPTIPVAQSDLIPPKLKLDLFTGVSQASAIAQLVPGQQISAAGASQLVLSRLGRSTVVEEGATKPASNVEVKSARLTPKPFVQSMRVSDQFLNASEENRQAIVSSFFASLANRAAVDLDAVVISGKQPDGSDDVSGDSFAKDITATVSAGGTDGQGVYGAFVEAAGLLSDSGYVPNGALMSASAQAYMLKPTLADGKFVPAPFAAGAEVRPLGVTTAVFGGAYTAGGKRILGIVGDFNALSWGMALNDFRTFNSGSPDGGADLASVNQVLLRSEIYYAWTIFDQGAFVLITE